MMMRCGGAVFEGDVTDYVYARLIDVALETHGLGIPLSLKLPGCARNGTLSAEPTC
jgi:hypothetical protein